tara:strand:+ start:1162 stop:2613 length:1452 start_codon:yes stop_codon:yes gene_type:complete
MNKLPDILKVGTLQSAENMEVRTEVLDPISSSNSEIVFQIPKNGILDGGSFVSLAVKVASGVTDAYLPVRTGIHGLIKSVQLMSGSKVIASNDDYAHYATMIRQFETPEHRAYVDMVKTGACLDRWGQIDSTSGRLAPKDMKYSVLATDNSARCGVPEFIKPTDNDASTPVFCVPLSHLVPFMRSRQLPLFAMKENLFLRLQLNTQIDKVDGTICCFAEGSPSSGVVVPSFTNIKFYSDHLYYTDGSMAQTQKAIFSEQGLSYLYEDMITTNAQIPATANPAAGSILEQKVERDLAVSGRTVRSIMIAEKNVNETHTLLGNYFSDCRSTNDTYNFRINENRLYDRDLEKPSHKWNELSAVMNKPLQNPNQFYSFDVDAGKATTDKALTTNSVFIGGIEGHVLPAGDNSAAGNELRGKSHYVGYDATTSGFNVLGNGKKIGVKPVIIQKTLKRTNGHNAAREMRIFANVERVINIKNGEVVVSS